VLTSNVLGRYFGDPLLEPALMELARREVPVFVHPADCPHIDVLGFGRPSSIVEFPFDTARNITNALYNGVFQRIRGLRLILAHCGGVLPSSRNSLLPTLEVTTADHILLGTDWPAAPEPTLFPRFTA